MARTVQPRVSYLADAGYLQKLIQAIEKDARQTADWKRRNISRLSEVVGDFNEASLRGDGATETVKGRASGRRS